MNYQSFLPIAAFCGWSFVYFSNNLYLFFLKTRISDRFSSPYIYPVRTEEQRDFDEKKSENITINNQSKTIFNHTSKVFSNFQAQNIILHYDSLFNFSFHFPQTFFSILNSPKNIDFSNNLFFDISQGPLDHHKSYLEINPMRKNGEKESITLHQTELPTSKNFFLLDKSPNTCFLSMSLNNFFKESLDFNKKNNSLKIPQIEQYSVDNKWKKKNLLSNNYFSPPACVGPLRGTLQIRLKERGPSTMISINQGFFDEFRNNLDNLLNEIILIHKKRSFSSSHLAQKPSLLRRRENLFSHDDELCSKKRNTIAGKQVSFSFPRFYSNRDPINSTFSLCVGKAKENTYSLNKKLVQELKKTKITQFNFPKRSVLVSSHVFPSRELEKNKTGIETKYDLKKKAKKNLQGFSFSYFMFSKISQSSTKSIFEQMLVSKPQSFFLSFLSNAPFLRSARLPKKRNRRFLFFQQSEVLHPFGVKDEQSEAQKAGEHKKEEWRERILMNNQNNNQLKNKIIIASCCPSQFPVFFPGFLKLRPVYLSFLRTKSWKSWNQGKELNDYNIWHNKKFGSNHNFNKLKFASLFYKLSLNEASGSSPFQKVSTKEKEKWRVFSSFLSTELSMYKRKNFQKMEVDKRELLINFILKNKLRQTSEKNYYQFPTITNRQINFSKSVLGFLREEKNYSLVPRSEQPGLQKESITKKLFFNGINSLCKDKKRVPRSERRWVEKSKEIKTYPYKYKSKVNLNYPKQIIAESNLNIERLRYDKWNILKTWLNHGFFEFNELFSDLAKKTPNYFSLVPNFHRSARPPKKRNRRFLFFQQSEVLHPEGVKDEQSEVQKAERHKNGGPSELEWRQKNRRNKFEKNKTIENIIHKNSFYPFKYNDIIAFNKNKGIHSIEYYKILDYSKKLFFRNLQSNFFNLRLKLEKFKLNMVTSERSYWINHMPITKSLEKKNSSNNTINKIKRKEIQNQNLFFKKYFYFSSPLQNRDFSSILNKNSNNNFLLAQEPQKIDLKKVEENKVNQRKKSKWWLKSNRDNFSVIDEIHEQPFFKQMFILEQNFLFSSKRNLPYEFFLSDQRDGKTKINGVTNNIKQTLDQKYKTRYFFRSFGEKISSSVRKQTEREAFWNGELPDASLNPKNLQYLINSIYRHLPLQKKSISPLLNNVNVKPHNITFSSLFPNIISLFPAKRSPKGWRTSGAMKMGDQNNKSTINLFYIKKPQIKQWIIDDKQKNSLTLRSVLLSTKEKLDDGQKTSSSISMDKKKSEILNLKSYQTNNTLQTNQVCFRNPYAFLNLFTNSYLINHQNTFNFSDNLDDIKAFSSDFFPWKVYLPLFEKFNNMGFLNLMKSFKIKNYFRFPLLLPSFEKRGKNKIGKSKIVSALESEIPELSGIRELGYFGRDGEEREKEREKKEIVFKLRSTQPFRRLTSLENYCKEKAKLKIKKFKTTKETKHDHWQTTTLKQHCINKFGDFLVKKGHRSARPSARRADGQIKNQFNANFYSFRKKQKNLTSLSPFVFQTTREKTNGKEKFKKWKISKFSNSTDFFYSVFFRLSEIPTLTQRREKTEYFRRTVRNFGLEKYFLNNHNPTRVSTASFENNPIIPINFFQILSPMKVLAVYCDPPTPKTMNRQGYQFLRLNLKPASLTDTLITSNYQKPLEFKSSQSKYFLFYHFIVKGLLIYNSIFYFQILLIKVAPFMYFSVIQNSFLSKRLTLFLQTLIKNYKLFLFQTDADASLEQQIINDELSKKDTVKPYENKTIFLQQAKVKKK